MISSRLRRVRNTVLSLTVAAAGVLGMAATPAQALAMYAGDSIRIEYSDGEKYGCTLNSIAYRSGAMYGVTAGHCLAPIGGAHAVRVLAADARTPVASNLQDSGFELEGDNTLGGELKDVAWFRMDRHVTDAHAMRGGFIDIPFIGALHGLSQFAQFINPTRRVAGRAPVTSVREGQIVCKDGARTSRTCGPVLNVNPRTGEIAVMILSLQGDSGSPLYTVNPDGSTNIVGIISGAAYGILVAADAATPLPAGLR
ncbi:hypothetical protein SAMN04488531_0907 [Corynebacterium coyleae]|uniref:S1 family peptidase n=1 Tax=Corynebacterium coyleae TaxID=53374 RepID=A0ABX8KWV1_9CORY|nr:hypothetical protein [Corynebacterium coyleae]QXB19279.1 S1 family peptidase [Corynebacterium coyleae]WJY80885.1 hypothetical protein CCOY_11595 [Corynebacterium coyleae]SEB52038.1 hypothetical protein SAMN04488531_0907 [Corynebacterium coyleae]